MACHIKNRHFPNLILIGLILIGVYSVQMQVSGNPVPGEFEETAQSAVETAKSTWETIKDFFQRMVNTFTGNVDNVKNKGLSHTELALVIVGAVLVFMLFFCCIGFFVCACVKELICCICCCSCCRD